MLSEQHASATLGFLARFVGVVIYTFNRVCCVHQHGSRAFWHFLVTRRRLRRLERTTLGCGSTWPFTPILESSQLLDLGPTAPAPPRVCGVGVSAFVCTVYAQAEPRRGRCTRDVMSCVSCRVYIHRHRPDSRQTGHLALRPTYGGDRMVLACVGGDRRHARSGRRCARIDRNLSPWLILGGGRGELAIDSVRLESYQYGTVGTKYRQRSLSCPRTIGSMDATCDAETYNLLLQLKELRCARLQVRHCATTSRAIVQRRAYAVRAFACTGAHLDQGGTPRGGKAARGTHAHNVASGSPVRCRGGRGSSSSAHTASAPSVVVVARQCGGGESEHATVGKVAASRPARVPSVGGGALRRTLALSDDH